MDDFRIFNTEIISLYIGSWAGGRTPPGRCFSTGSSPPARQKTGAVSTVRTGPGSVGQTVTIHPGRNPSRHLHLPSGSAGLRRAPIPRPSRFTEASLAVQRRKNASSPMPAARRLGARRRRSASTPTGRWCRAQTTAPRLWLRLKQISGRPGKKGLPPASLAVSGREVMPHSRARASSRSRQAA